MSRKAQVSIVGDATSFARSIKESSSATNKFQDDLDKLAVTAKVTAKATVDASVKSTERLRQQAIEYRRLADAAQRGSAEQVAAANLAAKAEKRLAFALGETSVATSRFGASSRRANADVERFGRGMLVGSGLMGRFGRTAAFASSTLLGGAGLVYAVRSTIEAAAESEVVIGQAAVAVKRAGLNWNQYATQVKAAALAQANLSGFDDEELIGTFSLFVRSTNDVTKALRYNAIAADVARGRNISLDAASKLVLKASMGQAGALRRVGIDAKSGASGLELVQMLSEKYAGAAKRYGESAAGAQARFGVAVRNTQEAIGAGLLPEITRLLDKGSDWLNNSRNQERIQRDVAEAAHILGEAFQGVRAIMTPLIHGGKDLVEILGGTKRAVIILGTAFVLLKLRMAALRWAAVEAGIAAVGTSSAVASSRVGLLSSRLLALNAIGPIGVTIALSVIAGPEVQKLLNWAGLGIAGSSSPGGSMSGMGGPSKAGGEWWANKAASFGAHDSAWYEKHPDAARDVLNKNGVRDPGTGKVVPSSSDASVYAQNAAWVRQHPKMTGDLGTDRATRDARRYLRTHDRPADLSKGAAATSASSGGQKGPKPLTDLQTLRNRLIADPNNVGLLNQWAQHDRAALKFIAAQRQQGDISNKQYQGLYQQYMSDLVSTEGQISSIRSSAAGKSTARKAAARKKMQADAGSFSLSHSLQVAAARAGATPGDHDDILVAAKTKAYAERAIAAGRLSWQGLIDAYNTIAQMNQTLGSKAVTSNSHVVSAARLAGQLGLHGKGSKALLAQALAHGGRIANAPGVDGFAVAGAGSTTIIHVNGAGDPDRVADRVIDKLHRGKARRPSPTSGPLR